MTSYNKLGCQPVIGFDMGGTSTDVSRYAGEYEHVFESTTAGVTIQAPQVNLVIYRILMISIVNLCNLSPGAKYCRMITSLAFVNI